MFPNQKGLCMKNSFKQFFDQLIACISVAFWSAKCDWHRVRAKYHDGRLAFCGAKLEGLHKSTGVKQAEHLFGFSLDVESEADE